MSTRELEIKFAKRTRIHNGGSRALARNLIIHNYSETELYCSDPPLDQPVGAVDEPTDGTPTYALFGTNTSPEKRDMHNLVNLDTMVGASGQPPQQNPPRKKRTCKTCSRSTCQGLNSRPQDKCLGIITEVRDNILIHSLPERL